MIQSNRRLFTIKFDHLLIIFDKLINIGQLKWELLLESLSDKEDKIRIQLGQ